MQDDEEEVQVNGVEVECFPADGNKDNCKFSWEIGLSPDGKSISMQTHFENTAQMSQGDEPDYALVKMWAAEDLRTFDGLAVFSEPQFFWWRIPLQTVKTDAAEATKATSTAVQTGMNFLLLGQLAFSRSLQMSLNHMYAMISNLQLFVFIPLYNTKFPPNSIELTKNLIRVASFDIFPKNSHFEVFKQWGLLDLYESWNLPETGPLNAKFQDIDYESTLFMINMGTLLLVAAYILLKYPLYYMAAFLSGRYVWCARQAVKLYPGRQVLDFCMFGYIQICFAVFINMYALEWTNDVIVNNCVMFTFMVVLVAFPVWLTMFMLRNYDHLQQHKYIRSYLPAYQNIDLQNNRRALYQPIIFIGRRLGIVLVSILLVDFIFVQILLLIYMQLAVLSYNTQVQPFVTRQKFWNEMFNEVTGLFVIYHLLTFTDFVVNPETRL